MINDKVFQHIFDEINTFLPNKWNKIVGYFEYGQTSYTFSFYVKNNDEYIKCYDLPGIDEEELYNSFRKIDKMLSDERKNEKNNWTVMTMVVDSTGAMKTDFDYSDMSVDSYNYMVNWKNKYLV